MDKLKTFTVSGTQLVIEFVETQQVKEGVECDIYRITDDSTRDIAIVTVKSGYKTPLQRILKGNKTIEGFLEGVGVLSVTNTDNSVETYSLNNDNKGKEVTVAVGQLMQWYANSDTDLVFYEVCEPPYEDGRFENIPEDQ